MTNLSEATRNLSSSLSPEILEEILSEMINIVEYELDVYVEEINGDNSYWVPTPDDEIEEEEPFGIIEIGADQSTMLKIIALTHEVGHCIFHREGTFRSAECVLFRESTAWFLGYHFMQDHGYFIDINEYNTEVEYSIDLYRRSENARNAKPKKRDN